MQTATHHSAETREAVTVPTFTPLAQEQRSHVTTAAAAHYLNRRPQTLRGWHCAGDFPTAGLRPLVLNGRLAWPVAGLRRVLGVAP